MPLSRPTLVPDSECSRCSRVVNEPAHRALSSFLSLSNLLRGHREVTIHRQPSELVAGVQAGCWWCTRIFHLITSALDAEAAAVQDFPILCPKVKTAAALNYEGLWLRVWLPDNKISRLETKAILSENPPCRSFSDETAFAASQRALSYLADRVNNCKRNHAKCHKESQWFPTRALHVQKLNSIISVKVVSREDVPSGIEYITLSHRWGDSEQLTLTSDTLVTFSEGIPAERLPRLFSETAQVAHQLNVPYLWIDSLCIIQDSEDDLAQELAVMDKVYHNAYANVAATFASDSSHPLFPDQSPLSFLSHKAPSPTGTPTNTAPKFWWFEGDARVFTHLDEQLLYNRGWVFQERCLATRNVSFTRSQLFFECSEELSCEATDISNPSLNNTFDYPLRYLPLSIFQDSDAQQDPELFSINRLDQLTKAQCLDVWHKMVQMYSPLALSDANDKLAAMSGLARRFHSRLQTPYYAGLWSANLRSEICWARAHTKRSRGPPTANNRVVGYRAPTWSWASVDGEVEIDYRGTSSFSWSFEILEAYTTPLKGDKFAQLADGRLGLRGTMLVVREEDARANNSRKALIFLNPPTRQPLYCYWDVDGYEVTFPFYAFILRSRVDRLSNKFEIHCLVLTPVTPSRGVYRRVGMGHLSNYGIDSPPTLLPEVALPAEVEAPPSRLFEENDFATDELQGSEGNGLPARRTEDAEQGENVTWCLNCWRRDGVDIPSVHRDAAGQHTIVLV
ncbi:hypothetical protein LRP88_11507 [Fusarium phalaenopsidis]|nr:HET domain-containing protein [Fusarium sp. Ph1]